MATTIDTLSAADRADFQKRLTVYGLDPTAVLQPDLVVPANTTMTLSASDAKSFTRPHLLNTSSVDELKSWIGVPDTLYSAGHLDRTQIRLPTAAAPAAAPVAAIATRAIEPEAMIATAATSAANLSAVSALSAVQLSNVHTATSAYLFGDSSLVSGYKEQITKLFPSMQIIFWPFFTITVNAGSVLTIGAGQNVLFAWKIIIHNGGMVHAPYGNLKVEATNLQKVSP
jgi:hypothetical protein